MIKNVHKYMFMYDKNQNNRQEYRIINAMCDVNKQILLPISFLLVFDDSYTIITTIRCDNVDKMCLRLIIPIT